MQKLSAVLTFVVALLFACAVAHADSAAEGVRNAAPREPEALRFSHMSDGERNGLETMLTEEVQRAVDRMKRIPGQQPVVTVRATLDVGKSAVVLDFSRGFLPAENGAEWEDLTQRIDTLVYSLVAESFRYRGTRFLIEGRGILDYYPDEIPTFPRRAPATR